MPQQYEWSRAMLSARAAMIGAVMILIAAMLLMLLLPFAHPAAMVSGTPSAEWDHVHDIHWAASRGDTEQVSKILRQDPSQLNVVGRIGTPLHFAAMQNRDDVARILIAAGADVNARCNSERTPLHAAATGGSLETAGLLLNNGADPNLADFSGRVPLHDAVLREDEEMAHLLLKRGARADIADARGETPAAWAREKKLGRMLQLLNRGTLRSGE